MTKRTGCGSSPSTSCSERPAWRSARSSAADSNAQLRKRSAASHSGGSGHSSSVARWSQKPASVHSPSSGSAGRVSCSAVPSSRNTETSSPEPVGAGADEPHVRRDALELVGEDGVQAVVLARLDDERQLREPRPQRLAPSESHRRHCLTGCSRLTVLNLTSAPRSTSGPGAVAGSQALRILRSAGVVLKRRGAARKRTGNASSRRGDPRSRRHRCQSTGFRGPARVSENCAASDCIRSATRRSACSTASRGWSTNSL